MKNTLTSKIVAASAVGVLTLGAAACSSDDTDDPSDPVEEIEDGGEDPAMEDDEAMEDDDAMEDDEG